jgi:hypothetical protein
MKEHSIIALTIPGYALCSSSEGNSPFNNEQINGPVGNSATHVITTKYKQQVSNNGCFTLYSNARTTNR